MQPGWYTRKFITLIASCAVLCAACGQTGDLYLPDRTPTKVPEQASPQNEAESAESDAKERENRRGTQDAPATDTQAPVTPPDPDRPAQPPVQPSNR